MKSRDPRSQSSGDLDQFKALEKLFTDDPADLIEKLEAFPKYVSRQGMAKFLARYELFKKILHVNGSIVECGVLHGSGTLTWAKLSSIFEPANHTRKIIGFDTFSGFPELSVHDRPNDLARVGGLQGSSLANVQEAVRVYDLNRPIAHIPKVELIKGDIVETVWTYRNENPHLVVAMLYLDVDLYEPTKAALQAFIPLMPRGALIVFDELNAKLFPGETQAVEDMLGLSNLTIKRFPFDSYISYARRP